MKNSRVIWNKSVVQFIGIAIIYNLDKKTMAQMNEELAARKAE